MGKPAMQVPVIPRQQLGSFVTTDSGEYSNTFGSYDVSQTPYDWTWYTRGSMSFPPSVVNYGGGVTSDYHRLEFTGLPDGNGNSESWLIKDVLGYTRAGQVEANVNFQTTDSGLAGVVLGWKDINNFAAVLLDQVNDTIWLIVYENGQISWQNCGYGSITIEPDLDYRLIAFAPTASDRGIGYLQVWFDPPTGDQALVFTSTNPVDLRGRMGVGVVDGFSRVLFDWFWTYGDLIPNPVATWLQPGSDGTTWPVYGDTIQLSTGASNGISVWYARYWRYDSLNTNWITLADIFDPPPYNYYLNTGDLNFGSNAISVDLYLVDGSVAAGPFIWLERMREPDTVEVISTAAELTADGQSHTDLVVEVKDRGGNVLPDVQVTFSGQNVAVVPATAVTNAQGRATVVVTAGTTAGTGSVAYQSGNVSGNVPIALLAGAPASIELQLADSQFVADGMDGADVVVIVRDANGNPTPNQVVYFGATLGNIAGSTVTDAQGRTAVYFAAGTTVGTSEITAGCGPASARALVTLIPGPPAQLAMTDAPVSVRADGVSSSLVRVQVVDAFAHPLAGQVVWFSTTMGSITPSAITNAGGMAEAEFLSGRTAGTAHVTAATSSLTTEVDIELKGYGSLYLAYMQKSEPLPDLANGNFDAGNNVGWIQLVNGQPGKLIYRYGDSKVLPVPLSPAYISWLGGEPSKTNQLQQTVTLPGAYSLSLEFAYYTVSFETVCTRDTAAVEALLGYDTRVLWSFRLCDAADTQGWRVASVDLGSLRGQSFILQFRSVLDSSVNSNLFLDNVRFCTVDPNAPSAIPRCTAQ
jgi:hypothetical protein